MNAARKIAAAPARGLKALTQMVFGRSGGLVWRFLPRTRFNYAREVGDGMGSSLIMAPILWMARTFPEAPLEVLDEEGQPIDGHEMVLRLRRPNKFYSGLTMWMAVIISWVLDGNAYLIKVRNKAGTGIAELWYAPHWTIEPMSDHDDVFIEYYRYSAGGHQIDLQPEEVVHLRYGLDPRNPRKGLSPLGTVLREVFTDDEAANFAATLLHNVGVPGLVVSPDGNGEPPSPDDVAAVKSYVDEEFTGDNRGKPLVMSGPTKVQQFGFSPEQMQVRELRRVPEERVTAAIGLPAIVVGLGAGLERSTFANFAEANSAAYEQNMVPNWRLFAEELWLQLLPDFDDNAEHHQVAFNTREVRALQEDRGKEASRVGGLYKDGLITRREGRVEIGYDAEDTDDVFVVPIAVTLVPVNPEADPRFEPGDDDEIKRRLKARQDGPVPLTKQADLGGVMVALYPPLDVAAELAQDGGEPAEVLHLTLSYLGSASDLEDETRLLSVVEAFAATCQPLSGVVSGIGHFTAGPDPVTYASADVPGLADARERLVDALTRAGLPHSAEHGFTPHITLAYDYIDPDVANMPLQFDRISVVMAGERVSYPLTGTPAKHRGRKDRGTPNEHLYDALVRSREHLSGLFARELETDLDKLGMKASELFHQLPKNLKAETGETDPDADRVLAALALEEWKDNTLRARLETQYQRVASQTIDVINTVLDLGVDLPDPVQKAIIDAGGTRAGLIDITEQTKEAIYRALADAREAGEGPLEAAKRIREYVSAGRFVNAGAKYRADLIARTETKFAQNLSSLAAYKEAPTVTAAIIYDGRGENSDAECEARDGEIVSFDEATSLTYDEHPNGTLSFGPVAGEQPL